MHIMGTFDRWLSFDSVRRWRVRERAATCHTLTPTPRAVRCCRAFATPRSRRFDKTHHTFLTETASPWV